MQMNIMKNWSVFSKHLFHVSIFAIFQSIHIMKKRKIGNENDPGALIRNVLSLEIDLFKINLT